jgi:hypothetical protein
MKRWAIGFTVIACAAAVFFIAGNAADWLKERIETAVHEKCLGCEFSIHSLNFSITGFALREIRLVKEGKGQRVTLHINQLSVYPRWLSLLSSHRQLESVQIIEPEIEYFDGGKPGGGKRHPEKVQLLLGRLVHQLQVHKGSFTYIRQTTGTRADLSFHQINGLMEFSDGLMNSQATGQMGASGHIELALRTTTAEALLPIDIQMQVRDQNLSDLSHFLEPNAGVKLNGWLLSATAKSQLDSEAIHSTLQARFKDFKLHVNPMYDRNDLQAFFTNLGTSIAMQSKNTQLPGKERIQSADLRRDNQEPLVGFILNSWKEAALKVVIR